MSDVLRDRLRAIRRRWYLRRLGGAACAMVTAIVSMLVVLFLLDRVFVLTWPQIVVAEVSAGLGLAWVGARSVQPLWYARTRLVDVALWVERRQRIDSDLVAALEFSGPSPSAWGSAALRARVVDAARAAADRVVLPDEDGVVLLRRRSAGAFCVLCAAAALLAFAPEHAAVFLDRLHLRGARYAGGTVLVHVAINGQEVSPHGSTADPLRVPAGTPLVVDVEAEGALPDQGELELRSVGSSGRTGVPLASRGLRGAFRAEIAALHESVDLAVALGDALSGVWRIVALAPPIVDIELLVRPPEYARGEAGGVVVGPGARQVEVLEGSDVILRVVAANKALAFVRVRAAARELELLRDRAATDRGAGDGRSWILEPSGTPFERVTLPLSFVIDAGDVDGLGPERPIEGRILIRNDHSPTVAAVMVTRHVLPTAKPVVSFWAADDFALASIRARLHIVRPDGTASEAIEDVPLPVDTPRPPSVRDRLTLDLAKLGLYKGSEVRVVLEATDYRGDLVPSTAESEPMILNVTDERGVVSAMAESDERSARQLDAIIDRQLGAGGPR